MKNWYWFTAAAVALVVSFLVQSPYMAYSIYAFLLLVLIAHVSSVAWLAGLDCERSVSRTTLLQGEDTEVEVTVTNRRGWPIPWIYLHDPHPGDFPRMGDNMRLAVLMPGRSVTLNYRLTCPRRGYHRIGPMVMESGDLFGLQKRFRTGEQQEYVSVLPTIAYIDTFNIASRRPHGPVKTTNRVYEDPSQLAGLREYQPGDPLKHIHWKASARHGELLTKTHEPSSVMGGTLILDLHADSFVPEDAESRMELAITVTASVAHLLHMSGEQVGMLTNAFDAAEAARYEVESQQVLSRTEAEAAVAGETELDLIRPLLVPTLKSPIQARKIAENLARVIPGKGLDAVDLIMNEYSGLPRDATLIPVVPHMSERLVLALAEMKLIGFSVSVFFIRDRKGYDEAASLLAQHNIHVFHIETERDLHELSPTLI